jgi:DivIVA domain-containing protein
MISPEPGTRFLRTRVRPGYDIAEVDHFIDRIEGTLGMRPLTGLPVSADDVRTVKFRTVRFRPGYDEEEVDEALDRYQELLAQRPPGTAW